MLLPAPTRPAAPLAATLGLSPLLTHQVAERLVLGIGEDLPNLAHPLATLLHGGPALTITPLPVHLAPLAVLGAKLLHPRPTLLGGSLAQLGAKLPHPLPLLRPLPLGAGALTGAFTTTLTKRLAVCLALLRASCGQLLELGALLDGQLERGSVREDSLGRSLPARSVSGLRLCGDPHREQG